MSRPALTIRAVTKYFGDFPAIREVSFEVDQGAILALLGRNGAGKTTMLRMIGGLLRPTGGTIEIPQAARGGDPRKEIGVLGHGQWIYDELTAEENLAFFARLYSVENAEAKIGEWLERTGLKRFARARVAEFSRGMKQRLAVARAFLHDPAVMLLDEPWSALDDRAVKLLSDLIVDARARGRTVVVCSHQLREALSVATEVAVLDRGRLAFSGPNDEKLKASPDTLYDRIP